MGSPSTAYDTNPYSTGTNIPANAVSWYEAAQFVNYLNTSTGHQAAYKFTGTQGTGGYTLGVWGAANAWGGTNLYRHKDAFYFLPTEDEWVKAAYWNGTSLQTYANASASDLISGKPDPAKWNYFAPPAETGILDVGSGIAELNGTFDMMGNCWEWMENPYYSENYSINSDHPIRGGSYIDYVSYLRPTFRASHYPYDEYQNISFRVASVPVPEPCSLILLSLGTLALIKRKR